MKKCYDVWVEYKGFDCDYDDKIEKVVGRSSVGGGFCLLGGVRDISFIFYQEKAARRAASRVRRQCRRMNTKVRVEG